MTTTTQVDEATEATPEAEESQPAPEAPEAQTPQQINRYSTWVHVGPGAEDCADVDEGAGTNDCGNPLHFHAWCRLPNQFQHRQIREKALAAKARKARQLRDPATDANAILEGELSERERADDREPLIEEMLTVGWWRDYLQATDDVKEDEADDGSKPFERIEHDQTRYDELEKMPEDERPADEYAELGRHLVAYHEAVRSRQTELIEPKRAELEALSTPALVDRIRNQRVDSHSNEEFAHVYAAESWFVGTLNRPRGEPTFKTREALRDSAAEVIDALKDAFEDLERTQNRGTAGNS